MAIKRLNYFNGQFLRQDDFKDEQQYHADRLKFHNKNLHTWGIADGFDVVFTLGEKKITVKSGMALDAQGRQIMLTEDREIDLSAASDSIVYLIVSYYETPSDPKDETGIKGDTRFTEEPEIKYDKNKPVDLSIQLVLAKVTLNSDKTVKEIDKTERKLAGAVAGEMEAKSLAFSLALAADKWPKIEGNIIGAQDGGLKVKSFQTDFSGALTVAGDIGIKGDLRINDKDVWLRGGSDKYHGLGWYGAGKLFADTNLDGPAVFGWTGGALGTTNGGQKIALCWNSGGNIGIGTITPATGKLQFANELGNKIVVWDGGASDRYGIGLNGSNLSAFIPAASRFSIRNNGFDGAEQFAVTGAGDVYFKGDLRINDKDIWLRGGSDKYHGLGWYGAGKLFAGTNLDGPAVFGWTGGALGTTNGGQKIALCWNSGGNIGIGTTTPATGKLQFANELGNKIVVWDGGASDRYGIGLNSSNLSAFIPTASRFSIRNNGFDGAELFAVTGTGNVGIGTVAPSHKFHVVGQDAVGLFESSGSQAFLRFSSKEGLDNRVEICNRPGGRLSLWTAGGGDVFNITREGNVGIGTTTPDCRLDVVGGDIHMDNAHSLYSRGRMHIHGEELLFLLNKSGVIIGKEWGGNGNLTVEGRISGSLDHLLSGNGQYTLVMQDDRNLVIYAPGSRPVWASGTQISDINFKKDIKPIDNPLERLLSIRGILFSWKDESLGKKEDIGVIAQEIEEVFPQLVSTINEHKLVNYQGLIPIIIEAIKVQQEQITQLEKKLKVKGKSNERAIGTTA